MKMIQRLLIIIGVMCYSQLMVAQDSMSMSNPYQVIYNHLYFLQDDNYYPEISAQSFPDNYTLEERVESAKMLKRVYDGKGLYVHVSRISKDSVYIDSIAGDHIYFPFPERLPDVYVEKTGDIWAYSDVTISVIPTLYKQVYPFGLDKVIDMLPEKQGRKILGFYTWQLLALLIFILLLIGAYFILSGLLNFLLKVATRRFEFLHDKSLRLIQKVDRYVVLASLSMAVSYILPVFRLPIKFSFFLLHINEIIFTIFLMMLSLGLINILKAYLKNLALATETKLDEQLLPIVIKMLKIVVVVVALFHILHLLNVNVTALIAGISIGGLALALAAQDTVKNLIGSMMIFFDKPFQIGDYIIAGSHEGSVVEVGFRSTRIKKIDTSIISIPNGALVNDSLTNLGVRNMRVMNITIGLMYNSTSENLQSFIEDLKTYVSNHEKIWQETKYIYLKELASSSIDVMFRVYIETMDYADELATKEEIIFNIIKIAEKNNVSFAFPSSSVYIEEMPKQ